MQKKREKKKGISCVVMIHEETNKKKKSNFRKRHQIINHGFKLRGGKEKKNIPR